MRYRYNCNCSCSRCRTHGFIGPAVLITVGVIFLLDQSGWMGFHTGWPALLIVIGLVMFLEHNASPAGHVPRGYGAMPPGAPGYDPAQPPPPVVTPPPVAPAGPVTPDTNWNRPNDPEVRNG